MYVNPRKKYSRIKNIIEIFIVAGFIIGLSGVAAASIFILTTPLPDPTALRERRVTESTKIYDRTGEVLLYEIYGEEKRTVVSFDEIPRHVKNAAVAIEDSNFYNHHGISPFSIVRAFATDLMRGQILVQGGSTITQQLVKNAFLSPEKTITRKLKEAVIALKIERVYTKDEILNMYLNEIPYGSNAYGIEAAAQTFFGKNARDLTLPEAAYLTALPKAPSYYSPHGIHTNDLELRKDTVLARMEELGFITPETKMVAKEEVVVFLPPATQGIRAPHFVMHVIDLLREEYGEEFLQQEGLIVHTSLDGTLQQHAEEVVADYADRIEKNFNAGNIGLTAIDPKTGDILAMVGSRDYFDRERDGNFNVTLARRQPGSAFKPLVYAASFEKGYTPETMVFDVSTEFAVDGAESYQPQNYDNTFRGPVSFREALAQSINIPAVKVLYLTGLANAISMAERLGISTLAGPNQYGLTLVLGGGEVQLLELTSVYGVFANDGIRNEPTAILRIEKNNGEVVMEHKNNPRRVVEQNIARMVSHVLSDNTARAPAFGSNSALYFPSRQVAAKTGTTNDYRDAWVLGYTPSIAAGVWAGNNDNTPMEKRVAGFIVAPIWHDFMARAFETMPAESFQSFEQWETQKPVLNGEWHGSRTYEIDSISGALATENTPPEFREIKTVPEIHSILHWVDKNNPQGPIPTNPNQDGQYKNWEPAVRAWAQQKGLLETEQSFSLPTNTDTVHTNENKPRLNIQSPSPNTLFSHEDTVEVRYSFQSVYPIKQIDYFLDGSYIGSQKGSVNKIIIPLSSLDSTTTKADIRLKAYDSVGNTTEEIVSIILN